jgi:hypothetical protein
MSAQTQSLPIRKARPGTGWLGMILVVAVAATAVFVATREFAPSPTDSASILRDHPAAVNPADVEGTGYTGRLGDAGAVAVSHPTAVNPADVEGTGYTGRLGDAGAVASPTPPQ